MYSANNSLTTRRDSGETRLDDLTKEIYSLQESREAASVNSILKIVELNTSNQYLDKSMIYYFSQKYFSKLLEPVLDLLVHRF